MPEKIYSESGAAIKEHTDQIAALEEKYQLKITELEVEIDEICNELDTTRLDKKGYGEQGKRLHR